MKFIDIYKKKEKIKINNELRKLRLAKFANNNISERDMINIRQLVALPVKILQQIAKLRNITTNLSKSDIIYALIRSEPVINEQKYIFDINNKMYSRINKIRMQLFNVSLYLNKNDRNDIRKRLYSIGNTQKIDKKLKNKLLKKLDSISSDLKFVQKT